MSLLTLILALLLLARGVSALELHVAVTRQNRRAATRLLACGLSLPSAAALAILPICEDAGMTEGCRSPYKFT